MGIRELLAGVKPRTKSVKVGEDSTVILHEFSTNMRMKIEEDRRKLMEDDTVTALEFNKLAAKFVSMSMLGSEQEPTEEDINFLLDTLGVDQLDELYIEALAFNGVGADAQEDARKN